MQVKAHYKVTGGKKVKVKAHSRVKSTHRKKTNGAAYRKKMALRKKDSADNALRKGLGISI